MSAITIPTVRPSVPGAGITPDDLLRMEDQGLFELVDGRLIEKKMGFLANETAGKIAWVLRNHLEATKAGGVILPEQSFQCFPGRPSQIRRPDVAFISASRVPVVRPIGHVTIVPDLAVEVVSPTDNVYELDEKLDDYHSVSIPLTWVVNPESRIVRVYRPGKPVDELRDGDTLGGEPVLSGFAVNISDLLPPRTA